MQYSIISSGHCAVYCVPRIYLFCNRKPVPLTTFIHFPNSPTIASGNYKSVFCIQEFCCFSEICVWLGCLYFRGSPRWAPEPQSKWGGLDTLEKAGWPPCGDGSRCGGVEVGLPAAPDFCMACGCPSAMPLMLPQAEFCSTRLQG